MSHSMITEALKVRMSSKTFVTKKLFLLFYNLKTHKIKWPAWKVAFSGLNAGSNLLARVEK